MNTKLLSTTIAVVTLFGVTAVRGQDSGPAALEIETLDLTMTLLPEGATRPDAITRVIELPAVAAQSARENAAQGQNTANEARANRESGLATAAEARENGREFGQQMREQAQENRENAGRGGPPDSAGPPNAPGPPGDRGPPAN